MKAKEFRRSMAVFPIGTVMELTDLTARQIRYYEAQGLIHPKRSDTNRRLYSLNDVDRLLEIMDLIEDGLTLAGIQKRFSQTKPTESSDMGMTDQDVRRILRDELEMQSRFN
ncbi:MerR family transcriptional regulator [Vaginisenegalia massiliensis]|uniref:MerR family transcriptional regulator n=1 Tax=Vaginisenegalia massiliensis TaxID=2058294 RepID=UPI000F539584|nr:MerR family transcriptional regulator [Vaginisenegalia massiliensis]